VLVGCVYDKCDGESWHHQDKTWWHTNYLSWNCML